MILIVFSDEDKHQDKIVSFQLSRQKGLYGDVEVFWKLTSHSDLVNATHQIYPTEGIVLFEENVNSKLIELTIKADMVSLLFFLLLAFLHYFFTIYVYIGYIYIVNDEKRN